MRHPTKSRPSTSPDSMAISALAFLGSDAERLERFLSVTGLGPHNLRGAAADPGFCGSVLDYVLADEPLLLAFAANSGVEPGEVALVRERLNGRRPVGAS